MATFNDIIANLQVVPQLTASVLKRRLAGKISPPPNGADFRERFSALLERVPADLIAEHRFVELPANQPPWQTTDVTLEPGAAMTAFTCGRTWLSRALDIWVEPHFQLWLRIGDGGTIFRGTRNSHSFTADTAGRLHLASYFPGEWSHPDGTLGTSTEDYRKVSGSMTVLLIRWCDGVDPLHGVEALAALGDVDGLVAGELDRLRNPREAPPDWRHLWFLGPAEIYSSCTDDGHDAICCRTHRDVAILQKDVDVPLDNDTTLQWSWKVDALPSTLREDTVPTHDYLSIAAEFDNGQDLTWMWSAQLPVGRHFRCPLPTWKARETHWVVRSGSAEFGRWLDESRAVSDDYREAIGGTLPKRIVRVWLISVSLFQRGEGRCAYSDIRLSQGGRTIGVT